MTYKVIELVQNSKDWENWRRDKIGASDSGTIMGQNPWKSPFRLWQEKLGLVEPEPYNDNMRRGHLLEPIARDLINQALGMDFKPMVLQSVEKPWMIASYDGIASDGTLLEIKCPKNGLHYRIPDHYQGQLHHQMHLAGKKDALFVSFHEGVYEILVAKLENEFCDKMLKMEEEFYRMLMEFEPPELCDKDYLNMEGNEEWMRCSESLIEIKRMQKFYAESEKQIRDRLIQLSGNANCQGHGLRLSKVLKKGAIDWKSIPAIQEMDIEPYRGKPVEYWRIS